MEMEGLQWRLGVFGCSYVRRDGLGVGVEDHRLDMVVMDERQRRWGGFEEGRGKGERGKKSKTVRHYVIHPLSQRVGDTNHFIIFISAMASLATIPPNIRGNEPPPEINPKTLAASFTTLLALGGLLFVIGTSEPDTFVSDKTHKTLLYIVGFSLGAIFYGLIFLSARLKYPRYIWAALSVAWVTFWFGVNQDVHPKKDFVKMMLIINSILAAYSF
ncbi:hypothetical protein C1H46_036468 [Malus baccata]|uniref:Uncharacterized protein n=1 Tax=Malus baccata TaxID=106549 RepID=A0A540KUM0_MALBA|nr:hypothetical protein C1H46_036468 [Malus baccata]